MLEEAWHWLRIDTPRAAQRLGYRREAAALRTRHRRCAEAWQEHLDRTRRALLESARQAAGNPGGIAVVLGAGLLRDIPWQDLLGIHDEVVLADIAFHPEARAARAQSAGRLRLQTIDVSGCIAQLVADPRRLPVLNRDAQTPLITLLAGARWVASVNLLTQIPLLPCAWLRRHGHGEAMLEEFALGLMRHHVETLEAFDGALCVVAEGADHLRDRDGAPVQSLSRAALLTPHLMTAGNWRCIDHWQWLVNPPGELPEGHTETRDLTALHRDSRHSPAIRAAHGPGL